MLTQKDLDKLKELVEVVLNDKLDEKLEEKLKHLPNKDEFYNEVGKIMKKLEAIRQEKTVQAHQISSIKDQLSKAEHKLGFAAS